MATDVSDLASEHGAQGPGPEPGPGAGAATSTAGELQAKVHNLNLEKEGLLHFIQHLKTRNAQLQTENDSLRSSSTPIPAPVPVPATPSLSDRKPRLSAESSSRAAPAHDRAQLESESESRETIIRDLRRRVEALEMDKTVLGHEVGGLRLERTGWLMERQRVGAELRELEAERTALRGKLAEALASEEEGRRRAGDGDEEGEGKRLGMFVRELQMEKEGLEGRLDARTTALRNAEEELRTEREERGAVVLALRDELGRLRVDLQESQTALEHATTDLSTIRQQLTREKATTRQIEEKLLGASTELVEERTKHLATRTAHTRAQARIAHLDGELEARDRARQEREKVVDELRGQLDEVAAELGRRNRAYESLQADLRRLCGGAAAAATDGPTPSTRQLAPFVPKEDPPAVPSSEQPRASEEDAERARRKQERRERRERKERERQEGETASNGVQGDVAESGKKVKRKKVKVETDAQPVSPSRWSRDCAAHRA